MLIFTDAGYKDGVSSHGYIVQHWNNQVIKTHSFISTETNPTDSEMASIISALHWVSTRKKLGSRKVRIYTDSLDIYEKVYGIKNHKVDVTYLKHQLEQLGAKLIWKRRHNVERAHKLASAKMKLKYEHVKADELKVKYKCEGISKFKSSKKKNTYKNKVRGF